MDFTLIIVIFAGFLGGFMGAQVGSGAIITLPALLFLGLEPSVAIGTNILSGCLSNFSAVLRYWLGKKIDFQFVIPFSVISFIGALVGANFVLQIDKIFLNKIMALFFIILMEQ